MSALNREVVDAVALDRFHLKARLLTEGCGRGTDLRLPGSAFLKRIHLYAHSPNAATQPLPDDLVIGDEDSETVGRLRYEPSSTLSLQGGDGTYVVADRESGETWDVHFLNPPAFADLACGDTTVGSLCSFLGRDVLGIVPSNHCFYFRSGEECRFCEIQATHELQIDYRPTSKRRDLIVDAVQAALEAEPRVRHLAITTGNVKDYDYTARLFVDLGRRLWSHGSSCGGDVLATLMPPDDLGLLQGIRDSGFTKIYFSLEVFDRHRFERLCPGKAGYGYERMLSALTAALPIFGPGNVYTNFVYGVQSLDEPSAAATFDPAAENDAALAATHSLLSMDVVPAFTLYHYGGMNSIGPIQLDARLTADFFLEWGEAVAAAGLVPPDRTGVLFGQGSLSNTLFNDAHALTRGRRSGAGRR